MSVIKCKRADYDLQRERVNKLAEKWIKPLGLGYWTIEIIGKDQASKSNNHDGAYKAFQCEAMCEYQHAGVTFFAPTLIDIDDDTLEMYFLHELMHIFLSELLHECDDLEWHIERVCTALAKGILWAVDNVR